MSNAVNPGDDGRSFWLGTACGIVRVSQHEMEAWISDPKRRIQTIVFDSTEGVRSDAYAGIYNPHVAKSTDGKVWFVRLNGGASVIDPAHLPFNKLSPPVHVEKIVADRKTNDASSQLTLPDGDGPAAQPRDRSEAGCSAARSIRRPRRSPRGDAVQGLRSSTMETNGLADAIRTVGEELAAGEEANHGVVLRVEAQGAPRALHPIVRDEILHIAGEALGNAFRHAEAKQIEVELRYDERELRLRVRDDGKGIDPKVLRQGGREGHFGMHGYARARQASRR